MMRQRGVKNKKKRQIQHRGICDAARELGVTRTHLYRVLRGERRSPRIEATEIFAALLCGGVAPPARELKRKVNGLRTQQPSANRSESGHDRHAKKLTPGKDRDLLRAESPRPNHQNKETK